MIATHRSLELQLVCSILFQIMVLYYIYVWVLVFVVFKLSITVVSTDWTCTIFVLLNGDFLLFFVVFFLQRQEIGSTQHPCWNCFGYKAIFYPKQFSSPLRNTIRLLTTVIACLKTCNISTTITYMMILPCNSPSFSLVVFVMKFCCMDIIPLNIIFQKQHDHMWLWMHVWYVWKNLQ